MCSIPGYRRALSLVVLAVLLVVLGDARASAVPSPIPQGSAAELQGDADCSGVVNLDDPLAILGHDAGISPAPCAYLADVQCDGDVDAVDALQLLRFDEGLGVDQEPGCALVGETAGGGPSSFELIDEALAAEDITEEEALLYTTFAAFGDSRLPGEFAGDDHDAPGTLILQRLSAVFDTLTPATQEAVAPFMLPPSAPGSWLELETTGAAAQSSSAVTWQTFTTPGGEVKVWAQDRYEGDAEKAQAIAAAMDQTIYPLLTGLMQREPLSDDGLPNNGGDGAVDIYLVHIENAGEMKSYGNSCQAGPGYVLVDSENPIGSETSSGMLQVAAHEFFHILEWTYQLARCWHPEYRWAVEGFAKWAEDFVYPQAQSEHPNALSVLGEPHISLDRSDGSHVYGTFLLPYYLWRQAGDASLIRQIWEAFEGDMNSVHAVGTVLAPLGGWDEVWPQVALYNWNREPVDDYKTQDGLTLGAQPEGGTIEVPEGEVVLGGLYNHLSARYHHMTFPDGVRSVLFKRNGLMNFAHLHVWAIAKLGGQWQEPEDWTDRVSVPHCRDLPGQDIQELVIIISNSDGDGEADVLPGAEAPIVEATNVECSAYVGSVSAEITGTTSGPVFTTEAAGFRFELKEQQDPTGRYVFYNLVESPSVTWTASGTTAGGCAASGTMTLDPADGTVGEGHVYGFLTIDLLEDDYEGSIQGASPGDVLTISCAGFPPTQLPFPGHPILFLLGSYAKIEGPVLEGERVDTTTASIRTWTWRLEPAP